MNDGPQETTKLMTLMQDIAGVKVAVVAIQKELDTLSAINSKLREISVQLISMAVLSENLTSLGKTMTETQQQLGGVKQHNAALQRDVIALQEWKLKVSVSQAIAGWQMGLMITIATLSTTGLLELLRIFGPR